LSLNTIYYIINSI
jgi:hypothetical protein